MATIKEIAEKAGVSRGTVDRVIHKRGRVDKEVEERVNRIIDSLSDRPNRAGQTLAASKKSHKTGVIMPSLSNPFFCDTISSIIHRICFIIPHFPVNYKTSAEKSPPEEKERL